MCVLAVLLLASYGCGQSPSVLEGKIVDEKGQTLANVKVTASQVRVVPKQEHYANLETSTGPDGKFRFEDIFPVADYMLTFSSEKWSPEQVLLIKYKPENLECFYSKKDGWLSNDKVMVTTGNAGKSKVLPEAFVIQPKNG